MRASCLVALIAVSQLAAQPLAESLKEPFGPTNRLVSPDKAYALFGKYEEAELWLEDTRTGHRKLVFPVTVQTLTLAWSPDSAAFIANDRYASDVEFAYIFDVRTLNRLDMRYRILAADPGASQFASAHSYFHAEQWLDARHVEVSLWGHTDQPPVRCFDLRYRVSRDGAVQKLSQHVAAITSKGCDWIR